MKPILFSTPMVQAILDDRKSMTRRVIKPQPPIGADMMFGNGMEVAVDRKADLWNGRQFNYKPKYLPYRIIDGFGDILYVRETWRCVQYNNMDGNLGYKVEFKDGTQKYFEFNDNERFHEFGKFAFKNSWQSSLFMPKEAARIFLKVTNVRVERVAVITEADAIKEGCKVGDKYSENGTFAVTAKQSFMWLWDRLNSKRGFPWCSNPWVWVYEFERVSEDGSKV